MQLQNLSEIIRNAQKKHPSFSKKLAEAESLGNWEIAVGDLIAKYTKPIRVKNSILWVEVKHPIWRSELHYKKQQILDILNGKTTGAKKQFMLTQETLKDIRFL